MVYNFIIILCSTASTENDKIMKKHGKTEINWIHGSSKFLVFT